MNTKKHVNGKLIILFIFAIVGIVVSFSLLKEDIMSTALTLWEYFPQKFGVRPATSMDGAKILGIFTSVMQIITGAIAFSQIQGQFGKWRWIAAVAFVISMTFDYWTDVVHRSSYFTGNIYIAAVTTLFYYTFGSELMQSFSWIIVFSTWSMAFREIMWFLANVFEGLKRTSRDWNDLVYSARKLAERNSQNHISKMTNTTSTSPGYTPTYPPVNNNPRPAPKPRPAAMPVYGSSYPTSKPTNAFTEAQIKRASDLIDEQVKNTARPVRQEPTYHPVSKNAEQTEFEL